MPSPRRFLLFLVLIAAGCAKEVPQPVAVAPAQARNPKIPVEVSYPIIEDVEQYNALTKKRVVSVRLNQKVSGEVLHEIALEVKASEHHQYERTFIFYYLPEKYGFKNSPWAISHFNPTLRVEILGMTHEDEEKLTKMPLDQYDHRIGAWIIDEQHIGHLAVIYLAGNSLKLDTVFTSGGKHTDEMIQLPSGKGRRFKKVKGSDIYEIDDDGVLRLYDFEEKPIVAAAPLK